ncbi:MAG: hypothetical protein ACOY3Z_00950 [Thermodesulfobacteriota bacterium]
MTGEQVAVAKIVADLVTTIGTWPIGVVMMAIIICPWISLLVVMRGIERRGAEYDKRFEAAVQMYENNVLLVKGYEKLASDLTSIIHLNIQAQTRLVEKIENNMYCPVIRERGPH